MIYFANPSTGPVRGEMTAGRLGCIVTPAQGNRLPIAAAGWPHATWCADNGCGPGAGGKIGAGYPGDRAYLEWLSHMSAQARRTCLFAVAPDVVGDATGTLRRSAPFMGRIRAWFGLPVAFAAQDGLEHLDVPWRSFDVLFLGGSTTWKLGPAARHLAREAQARGKRVHMGRVNSLRRLRYAAAIGCDSADGTYLRFGPDVNLPTLQGWLRDVNGQSTLFDLMAV
jgi:hypothetical protein